MTALVALYSLAALTSTLSQPASDEGVAQSEYQQPYQDATFTILNHFIDESRFHNVGQGIRWSHSFSRLNTRYTRIRFDNIRSPQGLDYRIRVVREMSGEVVASYSPNRFAQESAFMTALLPPGDLRVELKSDGALQGLSFRLERILWQAKSTEAVPQSNLIKIEYVRGLPGDSPEVALASSIAMLHIGPFSTSCTGVLVNRNTVATNYHCIEKSFSFRATEQTQKPSCLDVLVEFDYLAADQRGSTSGCLAVRAKKEVDVALLTFDPEAIRVAPGQNRMPVKIRPPSEGLTKATRLIHHPLGLPLAIDRCSIRAAEQQDLLHDCDTMPGSSGSPLFDDQMRLTGLHYKGPFPNTWKLEEIYNDYLKNGPRYNRAKISQAVAEFLSE